VPDGAVWLPFETEPVKMLSKKLSGPPDDCADVAPDQSTATSAIATTAWFRHRASPVSIGFIANLFLEALLPTGGIPHGFDQLNSAAIFRD
jgi:hypothetical protein